MKKFLYLCLFGTALAGVSFCQAHAGEADALLPFVKGEGMNAGEKLLSVPLRVGTNVAHGVGSAVVDGATAVGSGVVSGVKSVGTGIADGASWVGDGLVSADKGIADFFSSATDTGGWLTPSGIGDGLASGWKSTSDFFVNATADGGWLTPSGIVDGMGNGVNSLWGGAKSAWNAGTGKVTGLFSSGSNAATGSLAQGSPILSNEMGSFTSSGIGLNQAGDLLKGTDGNFYMNIGGNAVQINGTVTELDGGIATITAGGKEFNVPTSELPKDVALGDKVGDVSTRQAENAAKAGDKAAEATKKAATALAPDKASVYNVIQYAIVILQALEGTEQEDITKEVTVKAQELQDSQGSSTPSTISETPSTPDASLAATSLTGAANAMIALLKNNPIYPALLSEESCLLSGTSAASGTASRDSTEDVRATNNYIQCMQKKRLAFANTTALSAQVIAEGSNAISHEFYDRVSALATAAKGTTGTLGSMSVVNDSERFPYFEMVRGSALSAIQLELKGAETLSELTGLMEEVKDAQ